MPYVKSYHRRSPGAAATATPAVGRSLSVSIYDAATGSDFLKSRGGIIVSNVTYTTGLPGGFLQCTFVVRASSARTAKIDTGQKVIVRRGRRIVWWGWIEDIQRYQRGRLESLSVTCLGPWQNCQQRLVESWVSNVETADAVKILLLNYCERISSDFSNIAATGITLAAGQEQNFVSVASLINSFCGIGNSSDKPMLFAIWEPDLTRLSPLTFTNMAPNSSFELGTTTDATSWTEETNVFRSDAKAHTGTYAIHSTSLSSNSVISEDFIAVTEGKTYQIGVYYCLLVVTGTGLGVSGLDSVNVHWYDDDDNLLSTTTFDKTTDFPAATSSWQQFTQRVTAPADAVSAKLDFAIYGYTSVDPEAEERGVIDDVTFYDETQGGGTEAKPIPYFWARDLSDYDYMVYTARLDDAWPLTETTRQLANAVWASYGDTYTSDAQDATSQTDYRRRDVVVDAGELDATSAAQYRDTYLARWKDPTDEPSNLSAKRLTVQNKRGLPVDPAVLRAGDRLKVMDGPRAGTIVILNSTSYNNGVCQLTPDRYTDTASLLARAEQLP